MKRGLAGLFGALILACGGGAHWRTVASLSADLKATVIVEADDGAAIVFGYTGGAFVPLGDRRVAAVRVEPAGTVTTADLGAGWIAAADTRAGDLWAVHATAREGADGSDYALLVSQDGGKRWTEAGRIPADSLTDIAVEGAGRGWVIGVRTLLRTVDSGRTWMAVKAPSPARGVGQPLVPTGRDALVLGGAGLYRTNAAGKTWTRLADADVTATDGEWVVARGDGFMQIGRIEGDKVTWTARVDERVQPDAIQASGDRVVISAAPLGKDAGRRVLLFTSVDGGVHFTRETIGDSSDTATVALGPTGRVWRLDQSRRLKVRE